MEPLTLEDALKHCRDRAVYPAVFDITSGIGLHVEDRGCKMHTTRLHKRKAEGIEREVLLKITTWRGTSMNAMHWYGKVEVDGVECVVDDEKDVCSSCSEKEYPLCQSSYRFELLHILTQEEIDSDPQRWDYYDAGADVNGFESQQELIELFAEIARLRFSGEGWKFMVESQQSSKVRTLEEYVKYLNPKPKQIETAVLLIKATDIKGAISKVEVHPDNVDQSLNEYVGAPFKLLRLQDDRVMVINNEDNGFDDNQVAKTILEENHIWGVEVFGDVLLFPEGFKLGEI